MTLTTFHRILVAATITLTGPAAITPALAGGPHDKVHGKAGGMSIGTPGKTADAARMIEIVMRDNYYEPETLTLKPGETVRFVIKNAGEFVHEFSIATADMHVAHQPKMMMMMEHGVLEPERVNWEAAKKMQASMGHGSHDEPNSVLLEPGERGEIVWTFPDRVDLQFACNVPGHYDSGMQGEITLTR